MSDVFPDKTSPDSAGAGQTAPLGAHKGIDALASREKVQWAGRPRPPAEGGHCYSLLCPLVRGLALGMS